ncbi:MAG: metalloregulator ArsR/SmtB family transcription factor [candidate division Zixibacteria bacterium]|nr:metalloregulator ArsR/SmtB family transcription factor [candidate division Zixibacteria bacterium]
MDERTYSKYFKAFGDQSRLRIVALLAANEMSVGEITDALGLAQPTISRHLSILRDADIVVDRRDGQRVFYRLNKDAVRGCCTGFCNSLAIPVQINKRKRA